MASDWFRFASPQAFYPLAGRMIPVFAALAAVLCSFTYVVAQIYGVGLIASRLTGVQFEIGIMLVGAGGLAGCVGGPARRRPGPG